MTKTRNSIEALPQKTAPPLHPEQEKAALDKKKRITASKIGNQLFLLSMEITFKTPPPTEKRTFHSP